MVIKDGRFGAYVTDGEINATLRRGDEIETITAERAAELLAEKRAKGPAPKKRPAKKAAAKKAATTNGSAAAKKAAGQEGRGQEARSPVPAHRVLRNRRAFNAAGCGYRDHGVVIRWATRRS